MTNEELIMLSKFAISVRKFSGNRVEVDRFVSDSAYAKTLLDLAEEHAEQGENMEMMVMVLKLRQKVVKWATRGRLSARQKTPQRLKWRLWPNVVFTL